MLYVLRLRTDLLSPIEDPAVSHLSGEVEFASVATTGFDTPLWLPRQVQVTTRVNSQIFSRYA